MANDELAERLADLEVKVAYQDHTAVALDGVVRDLAARVIALEAELGRMRALSAPAAPDVAGPTPSE